MPEELTRTTAPSETAAPESSSPPGSPPGYELIDEIGHGGMGIVYRARDTALDRDVAVKLLAERYPADSPAAQRFLSEARITGQLQHPGIPAVHQVGALPDGRPFLAMKLIKGSTLETLLKQMWDGFQIRPTQMKDGFEIRPTQMGDGFQIRPTPAAERGQLLAIFESVCQAVGYAHAHRVIHRDLKPANVMVGAFGEVQVMDWGLAKILGAETPATAEALAVEVTRAWTQLSPAPQDGSHTQAGSLVGTPAFIAPEQALGEIEKVNERADVFGLGALLAVILTGKPPYVGETAESVRVQAVRGKLDDCFARLDACGAEPELVALCKKCLAFEPADRPADAGAVAAAVAGLRAAADERARRAELDKVCVEGEKAAAEARTLERRKRRRLWLGAAAALVLAAVGGLSAVLTVQRRANAELKAEQAKVQARFDMATKAIALFHTSVNENILLQNPGFKELRTKLLEQAAEFYANLEKLLAGQTDVKSRQTLATAYFQLGELTDKIGDKKKALAAHRKALALRRELAAEGADEETRLDVARSLEKMGGLLRQTGDHAGALTALEEQRELAERLAAEHSTDALQSIIASSHHNIAWVLSEAGKGEEALKSNRKALAIRQKLADANPAVTQFQSELSKSHNNMGVYLRGMGKMEEALKSYRQALAIQQKLADANPAVTQFQSNLAANHSNIGVGLMNTGKLEEALASLRTALAILQKLADANPAVTKFQASLAMSHFIIGEVLINTGKPEEALASSRKALAIYQKLADANPAVAEFQRYLAASHNDVGNGLSYAGKLEEALRSQRAALAFHQKRADANPAVTQSDLARSHHNIGGVLRMMGKPEEALASHRKALAIYQKLADAEPAGSGIQRALAWSHSEIGNVLMNTGKLEEALASSRKALAIYQKLADADPAFTFSQSSLAESHNRLGRLLVRQKQFAEGFTHIDAGLAIFQKSAEAHPKNTMYTMALGYSHAIRGSALVRSGQSSKAAADLRQAVELWAKAPALSLEMRFERSRVLALLAGLGGNTKSGVTTAEAAAFADQAVAALRDTLNAGWGQLNELKEPDFDALRGRDDFKKLLAKVETRNKAKAAKKQAASK